MAVYKIYIDGTEVDMVHAESPSEAIMIVKSRMVDTTFELVVFTYRMI